MNIFTNTLTPKIVQGKEGIWKEIPKKKEREKKKKETRKRGTSRRGEKK